VIKCYLKTNRGYIQSVTLNIYKNYEARRVTVRKSTIFWVIPPCISERVRGFGYKYRLHLQGRKLRSYINIWQYVVISVKIGSKWRALYLKRHIRFCAFLERKFRTDLREGIKHLFFLLSYVFRDNWTRTVTLCFLSLVCSVVQQWCCKHKKILPEIHNALRRQPNNTEQLNNGWSTVRNNHVAI
jgi:hypothetical protein